MAAVATLKDAFSAPPIDTTLWTGFGTSSISGARLVAPCTLTFSGVSSVATNYDLTSSQVAVRVDAVPTDTAGTTATAMWFFQDANNYMGVVKEGASTLRFQSRVASVTTSSTVTYDGVAHLWWRIKESAGSVTFDTSADSLTWTAQRTISTPAFATAGQVQLSCGYTGAEVSPGNAIFDNLNLPYATLTATPDTDDVAVFLSLTGADTYTSLYIVRTNSNTGTRVTLFDGPVSVVGGSWADWDYEIGMDDPYIYTAEFSGSPIAGAAVSAIPSDGRAFLKCPPLPQLNQQIYPIAVPEVSQQSRSSAHPVLNRPLPVVITSERAGPEWTLELYTETSEEFESLKGILRWGMILLLVLPPATGIGNAYVMVGDVTCTPLNRLYNNPARKWKLPMIQTDRAVGASLGGAGVRWADVLAAYPTWADLLASKPTWLDVLQGIDTDVAP